jgi:hypothetical protein
MNSFSTHTTGTTDYTEQSSDIPRHKYTIRSSRDDAALSGTAPVGDGRLKQRYDRLQKMYERVTGKDGHKLAWRDSDSDDD